VGVSNLEHISIEQGGKKWLSAVGEGRNYFRRTEFERSTSRNEEMRLAKHPWRNRVMVRKIALAVLLSLALSPAASFAQVVVRIAPPAPIVEVRGEPPERGFVWIDGYHRWDGGRYVWVPGRWDRPPHPGQRWVAHRWVHHGDHWEMREGHWR
jgi:hypothetical protein